VPNPGAGVGLLMERNALEENEFRHAGVIVEADLGLMVATLASSPLAPDVRGTLDAEFVCSMQAGSPVGSRGDSAARHRAANGFEIDPRLWSELNGLAQSSSSAARGSAS
jgi:hypothetical protein